MVAVGDRQSSAALPGFLARIRAHGMLTCVEIATEAINLRRAQHLHQADRKLRIAL